MPSAPSIICATKPTAAALQNSLLLKISPSTSPVRTPLMTTNWPDR